MRMQRRWVLVLALCGVAGPVFSEDSAATPSPPERARWTVVLSGLGQLTDEPNVSLVRAFADAGLDGHRGVFRLSWRRAERLVPIFAYNAEAGYALRNGFELRLLVSPSEALFGRASAFSGSGETAVGTKSFVQTFGAMVAYRRAFLRVGLGPSLNLTTLSIDISSIDTFPQDSVSSETKATKLGAIFEAAVVLPEHTRVFVEAKGQYRYVGAVDVGPLSVSEHGRVVAVVATSVPFDYAVVSLGLGFRF